MANLVMRYRLFQCRNELLRGTKFLLIIYIEQSGLIPKWISDPPPWISLICCESQFPETIIIHQAIQIKAIFFKALGTIVKGLELLTFSHLWSMGKSL